MAPLLYRESLFALFFTLLAWLAPLVSAIKAGYVIGTIDGREYLVRDNREPSLYTKDYGDCMGGSLINVTRFDAAYYKDNMTILFHLEGETVLKSESIMSMWGILHDADDGLTLLVYIGVYAYGETQFDLNFNPCNTNIHR